MPQAAMLYARQLCLLFDLLPAVVSMPQAAMLYARPHNGSTSIPILAGFNAASGNAMRATLV